MATAFGDTLFGRVTQYNNMLGLEKKLNNSVADPVNPERPDYNSAAERTAASGQSAINQQTAANRPDQSNPFASSQWVKDANGNWTQQSNFSGQLGSANQSLQQQYADMLRTPMGTGDQARDQAINASYGQATSRLDPQWDRREAATRTQLLNQGLDPSSEAYRNQMSEFGQQRNDAYGSAMNSAIGQGTEAGSAIFGQNMAQRQMPLQQMQGMQGLLGQQGFQGAGNAGPTNYLGAAQYQGQFDADLAAAKNKQNSDFMGGLGSAAGGIIGAFSDERLKRDIIRHEAEAIPGVPVASWEYVAAPGRRFVGVIAQDLAKVSPAHVVRMANGFLAVDYSFAPGLFREVTP